MTVPDPALAEALDKLTMQVNRDNVLAVHKLFRDYADELRTFVASTSMQIEIGLCGLDPVSAMAAGPDSFGGKVHQLLEPHWAHARELDIAARHLRAAALDYGYTDDTIDRSLTALS